MVSIEGIVAEWLPETRTQSQLHDTTVRTKNRCWKMAADRPDRQSEAVVAVLSTRPLVGWWDVAGLRGHESSCRGGLCDVSN
jgi:hypothetical protein